MQRRKPSAAWLEALILTPGSAPPSLALLPLGLTAPWISAPGTYCLQHCVPSCQAPLLGTCGSPTVGILPGKGRGVTQTAPGSRHTDGALRGWRGRRVESVLGMVALATQPWHSRITGACRDLVSWKADSRGACSQERGQAWRTPCPQLSLLWAGRWAGATLASACSKTPACPHPRGPCPSDAPCARPLCSSGPRRRGRERSREGIWCGW